MRDRQAQMALSRQRLLTMAFGDMETIQMVGRSFSFRMVRLTDTSVAPKQLSCKLSYNLTLPLSLTLFIGTGSFGKRLDEASPRCPILPAYTRRICIAPRCCEATLASADDLHTHTRHSDWFLDLISMYARQHPFNIAS